MSKWDDESSSSERDAMVTYQLESRGIKDERILDAMRTVPRHIFIPYEDQKHAYKDGPLPIGHEQTISQPYIVASMLQAANLWPHFKVLEVGTGSGYQAAILSHLCKEVHTMEIVKPLAWQAKSILEQIDCHNVTVYDQDAYDGLAEHAPFNAIFFTAATKKIPSSIMDQLAMGGVILAPLSGNGEQQLVRISKTEHGLKEDILYPVMFVPMTGKIEEAS